MRADQEATIDCMRENAALRALIADLIYSGTERGYTRGSVMWAEQVAASAREVGLSEADIQVLTDMEPFAQTGH